jgi:ectoine hydroxylase-related dioxygenase (phytanoyl-CoA dioxygenase family)
MSLISEKQITQFKELGYFVTEPMWSLTELDAFMQEFRRIHDEEIERARAAGRDAKHIELLRVRAFIGQAHTRSDFLKRFVKSPIYLEACARFIGPDADLYYNQLVHKPPEKGRYFGWHQDSGYVVTEPLEYITCWTAITRSFLENGCIWVVPGSHKWGLQEHVYDNDLREYQVKVDESKAIPVPMERGQVAIFSSLTLHKSGPNTSNEPRLGYVPQYHVPRVISKRDGKLFGDQFPVLRAGKAV